MRGYIIMVTKDGSSLFKTREIRRVSLDEIQTTLMWRENLRTKKRVITVKCKQEHYVSSSKANPVLKVVFLPVLVDMLLAFILIAILFPDFVVPSSPWIGVTLGLLAWNFKRSLDEPVQYRVIAELQPGSYYCVQCALMGLFGDEVKIEVGKMYKNKRKVNNDE